MSEWFMFCKLTKFKIASVQNILVNENDLKAVGRDSIILADGSGSLVTLDVFHQIHCL